MSARVSSTGKAGSGHGVLALVVGLLMLPFVLGAGLYISGWQPVRSGNHGQLLQPVQALGLAGEVAGETAGKWLLILAGNGPCGAECARRIDEMRRIQVSLNKDMGRLRRLVLTAEGDVPALAATRAAQPDLLVAILPGSAPAVMGARDGYRFYVADPQGNLVLHYPPDVPAKDIRADLDRLLKFAWTG